MFLHCISYVRYFFMLELTVTALFLSPRNLSHQKLSGEIPPDIGKLDRLEILYVFLVMLIFSGWIHIISKLYANVFYWKKHREDNNLYCG